MKNPDYEDVSYGNNKMQTMDIYLPTTEKCSSAILLIHGGGFYCCDKKDFHIRPAKVFLEMGFAVASVNYRMAPKYPFPYPGRDIKRAVRWIYQYGQNFGMDGSQLFLHGTSAGGNLAAIEGLKAEGGSKIRAAALLCPVICIGTLERELKESRFAAEENLAEIRKIISLYLGGEENLLADADFHIRKQPKYRIPFFVQHGDADKLICLKQSEQFIQKLRQRGWKGDDLVFDILKGADHAGAGEDFYRREAVERIGRFFRRYLNG